MAEQISKELGKKDVVIDKEIKQIIRLAAIFHDCGHLFCSHASERYFQKNRKSKLYSEIEKIRNYFNTKLGIKPSLSEIISILIVNSHSIRDSKVNTIYKMAIAPAAINTIDQLVISRFMMFENIYYHQKTLTAEEMLRYALLKLDQSTSGMLDDFSKILFLDDSVIINNKFAKSIESVIQGFEIEDTTGYMKACDILNNIYKRQLFKRCVVFTDKNLTKAIQKEKDFFIRIIKEERVDEQEAFVNEVVQEIIKLKELLKDSKYHFNKETDVLLLIAPDISSSAINSNISIDDKSNKDRDMEFEADSWLQSRASRKPQNYLVSYSEDRYLVYIATEIVLLNTYGLVINDTIIYTEDDENYINDLKEFLNKKNYFQKSYILAPDSLIKLHESDIDKLVEKWKAYEIFDINSGEGIKLDATYLMMHMKQFLQFQEEVGSFDIFLKGYLEMLSNMRVISKETIAKALNSNFRNILKKESCMKNEIRVCNIGGFQDGSALVAYHMNIVNQCLQTSWKTEELTAVLETANSGQIIVFLEDAFCSGKQILSIFETYMGIPLGERQTQEVHVNELSDEKKEILKKCKLIFSFIFYEQENEEFFYNRFKEIGLEYVQIVARETFDQGYFKRKISSELKEEVKIVKKYMENAGQKLIEWKAVDKNGIRKQAWDDERMKSSILGYNDAQQLIAFSWNTPTYTMTPLWLKVDTDEFKWAPLFPRIDK